MRLLLNCFIEGQRSSEEVPRSDATPSELFLLVSLLNSFFAVYWECHVGYISLYESQHYKWHV